MDRKPILRSVALCCCFNKVLVLSIIYAATALATPAAAAASVRVPAMYVFGDSLADVGNNNYLPDSQTFANFRPYGVDYPGGVPTGRFSNGYVFVDFLAMKMGFKESPPAALSVTNNSDDGNPLLAEHFRGLNFASGAAGILDSTGINSLSLSTQVDMFAKVVDQLVSAKGKPAANDDLSRSLFIFSTGVYDLVTTLAPAFASSVSSSSSSSSLPPPDAFVTRLVGAYRDQLRRIYNLGARKFVFLAIPKAGCMPGVRAMTATGSCLDLFNVVIRLFNKAVQDMLAQGLANSDDDKSFSEGFHYSIINAYDLLSRVMANPLPYGITEVNRACCGLGTLNAGGGCEPNTTNYCFDRTQHLFWDASYPSQTAAKLIADYGFNGPPKFAYPISIAKLLRL